MNATGGWERDKGKKRDKKLGKSQRRKKRKKKRDMRGGRGGDIRRGSETRMPPRSHHAACEAKLVRLRFVSDW